MLFKIGRKLSTSGAISSIYEIYNPPITVKILFFIIGLSLKNEKKEASSAETLHLTSQVITPENRKPTPSPPRAREHLAQLSDEWGDPDIPANARHLKP